MKTFWLALLLFAPFLAAPAQASPPPQTYISVATFTAGGDAANVWAFQNTSTTLDVRVLKIEVSNASTEAVSGGLMQFWLYGSTVVTHGGTSQVGGYGQTTANATLPTYVSVSTGPVSVTYEKSLPLARPLISNDDETATTNLSDSLSSVAPADGQELLLPHNTSRALILTQKQHNGASITAGVVMVRVLYTIR